MDKEISLFESSDEKEIKNLIYEFRGKQVMLDSDLAMLFEVEVKYLNRQMKRNLSRFPKDFCFQLWKTEMVNLRCQNVTASVLSSKRRYNPYAYTEQGIIALAGVLKSEVADEMCVKISRVFVKMRYALTAYSEHIQMISKLYGEFIDFKEFTISKLDDAFTRIEKLEPKKEVLLLDDQWFDACDAIIRLIKRAKRTLVLIDPYADEKSLEYMSHKNKGVKVVIYKGEYSKLKDLEVEAFAKQYGEIEVKEFNKSHNRYLIIDSNEVYDLGVSLNSVGNKIFTINKMEIEEVADTLIKKFS